MGYIIQVDTDSPYGEKVVLICCANRFQAKRAIKDTKDIIRKTRHINKVRIELTPTLLSQTTLRRLSMMVDAEVGNE